MSAFSAGGKVAVAAPVELKAEVAIEQSPALVTNPPAGQVYRSYYFFGSVRVAMREFSGSTNVLTYLVTDHLGSTSLTLDASGVEVARMGYKPWGETRYTSGTSATDYKFTGQLQLNIGIYLYGSRFYDTLTGRFLTPDSIIPAPGNPLAFDRYAYVFNSPLMYIDPSGHTPVCGFAYSDPECFSNYVDPFVPPAIVVFTVDPIDPQDWTTAEMQTIRDEAQRVAKAYANAINSARMNDENNQLGLIAAYEAFLLIHEGPINFIRTSRTMNGWAGQSRSKNEIIIYNLPGKGGITYNYVVTHPAVIVHEIGHSFDWANDEWGSDVKDGLSAAGLLFRDHDIGFAGGMNIWQFSYLPTPGEIFADMFVGWVYDKWGDVPDRRYYMTRMAPFIVNFLDW